jgi:AraC-like DNA-binding protein
MDALSDVLKSVRLEGALYVNGEFTAPWCIRGECGLGMKEKLADAGHVVYFHFLTEGRCRARLAKGGEVLEVSAGDLILIPRYERHILGSDLQLEPLDATGLQRVAVMEGDVMNIRHGGGGAQTRFVCGYLACSHSLVRPLLVGLPRILRIPIGGGPAEALLRELLRVGMHESAAARPGGDSMLAKLSELLFVEAMRRYAESLPPEGRGWLAAVRDAHVGRALALLHAEPATPWTVDELARKVALSRSALADRFTSLLGEPPMQYLMRWRLALAAQALRSGEEAIQRVAEKSGYESEAAFSRAFKREFGVPPAAWRRRGAGSLRSPRSPAPDA